MAKKSVKMTEAKLRLEILELRSRLSEAEETLDAIRNGEVDALFVSGADGEKVFSLTSAETPYRIFIEEMNEGAATLAADGTILYCNRQFSELISVPFEKTIGVNFIQLVPEIGKAEFDSMLKAGMKENCKCVARLPTSNAEEAYLHFSLSPLPSTVLGDVCLLVSDITELKKKEAELKRASDILEQRVAERTAELKDEIAERKRAEAILMVSEERLKKAQEIGHVGCWEYNIKDASFWASDEGKRVYGFNSESDHFTSEEVMKCVIERDRVNQAMIDLLEKNKPYNIIFDIIPRNASTRKIIHSIAHVVSDEHGNPVKVTGILHDITDLKKSENEIRLKNEELQKAIAEKDKFFSILAHDLRSPFNAFLGFTKMMVDELPSLTRDQITKIAISMNKSANNTYRLLANLLEWSRLQRGLIHVNPEPFLLMRQTAESLEPLLESANMKGIEIRFNIPDDMIVYADGNMLGSIIRNLTSNAVKFTRRGGKINISAKLLSDSFIEVSVNDNGMGMSKQLMKDLFCLEESANRKGTAGEPSTGLGLIICKEFIEKHGGKLWVESEEENLPAGKTGGSTFYFTIPVNQ